MCNIVLKFQYWKIHLYSIKEVKRRERQEKNSEGGERKAGAGKRYRPHVSCIDSEPNRVDREGIPNNQYKRPDRKKWRGLKSGKDFRVWRRKQGGGRQGE